MLTELSAESEVPHFDHAFTRQEDILPLVRGMSIQGEVGAIEGVPLA